MVFGKYYSMCILCFGEDRMLTVNKLTLLFKLTLSDPLGCGLFVQSDVNRMAGFPLTI